MIEEHIPVGSSYLFSLQRVCVKGAPARVTDVQVTNTQGSIHVVDWGTRSVSPTDTYTDDEDPGAQPGRVSAVRGFAHASVTSKCSDAINGDVTEVDVSVRSGSADPAISNGFTVTYSSAGHDGSLFLPYQAVLCSAACPQWVSETPLPTQGPEN